MSSLLPVASLFTTKRYHGIFMILSAAVMSLLGTSSCTLLAHSPYVAMQTRIPVLERGDGLIVRPDGTVPYQRWRTVEWGDGKRYLWIVGNHDFRRFDGAELILYFHGMHSKDYYRSFRKELEELAEKRRNQPFLFVAFVDTPYASGRARGKNRWRALVPEEGSRPDRLFRAVNTVYQAFRTGFPHIKKRKVRLAMAGFSGGGRVLDSVGNWLAEAPSADPFARVFRSRLSRLVYFDCWFDPQIVETVPSLLKRSPAVKIVGTVHMAKPRKHAEILAGKLKLKKRDKKDELEGVDGRVLILNDRSHWDAMICRLSQALDG